MSLLGILNALAVHRPRSIRKHVALLLLCMSYGHSSTAICTIRLVHAQLTPQQQAMLEKQREEQRKIAEEQKRVSDALKKQAEGLPLTAEEQESIDKYLEQQQGPQSEIQEPTKDPNLPEGLPEGVSPTAPSLPFMMFDGKVVRSLLIQFQGIAVPEDSPEEQPGDDVELGEIDLFGDLGGFGDGAAEEEQHDDRPEVWEWNVYANLQTGDMCESSKRQVSPVYQRWSLLTQRNPAVKVFLSRNITDDGYINNCHREPMMRDIYDQEHPIYDTLPHMSFLEKLRWTVNNTVVIDEETGETEVRDVYTHIDEERDIIYTYIVDRMVGAPRAWIRVQGSLKPGTQQTTITTVVWMSFTYNGDGPDITSKCRWGWGGRLEPGCGEVACRMNLNLGWLSMVDAYNQQCRRAPPICWYGLRLVPGNSIPQPDTPDVSGNERGVEAWSMERLQMNFSKALTRWYGQTRLEVMCDLRNVSLWTGSAALIEPCWRNYDTCAPRPDANPIVLHGVLYDVCTNRTCPEGWDKTLLYDIFERATMVFNQSYHEFRCTLPAGWDACNFGPGLSQIVAYIPPTPAPTPPPTPPPPTVPPEEFTHSVCPALLCIMSCQATSLPTDTCHRNSDKSSFAAFCLPRHVVFRSYSDSAKSNGTFTQTEHIRGKCHETEDGGSFKYDCSGQTKYNITLLYPDDEGENNAGSIKKLNKPVVPSNATSHAAPIFISPVMLASAFFLAACIHHVDIQL